MNFRQATTTKVTSAEFFSGRPDAADCSAQWSQSGFMGPLLTSCSDSQLSNSAKSDRNTDFAIRKALEMLSYQACGIAIPLETLLRIWNINRIMCSKFLDRILDSCFDRALSKQH